MDQGSHRRRFAGAGRAGHQHQAAPEAGHLQQDRRHLQFPQRRNPTGDNTGSDGNGTPLPVDIDTEAPLSGQFMGDIHIPPLPQLPFLLVCRDFVHQRQRVLVGQGLRIQVRQFPMPPNGDGVADQAVQVRGVLRNGVGQNLP